MTPSYSKIHNLFKFNGLHFSHEELKEVAYSLVKEGEIYEKAIGNFLIDWLDNKSFIEVTTSGSTGQPKIIKLMKQAMVNSAIATGDFFGLKPGDKALNCLPSHYIAGKMMLVRAMILGLEIDCVEPSSQPIFDYKKRYDFSAMVPMQLSHVISYTYNIKTIIIGGSKLSNRLLERIKTCSSKFFETYGMTETVTHVAVKRMGSKVHSGDNLFKALPNITFLQDERNCLVINAPMLINEPLTTNDIVDLKSEKSFKFIGRFDNVINSGGIKLFPEQIEEKLQPIIEERFFVAGEKDEKLGERLVLVIEKSSSNIDSISSKIKALETLDKFEIPKKIYTTNMFSETNSGKIQRSKTLNLVIGS